MRSDSRLFSLLTACAVMAVVLSSSGCGSDKLKREVEEKNKALALVEEIKKKGEADLAAKDQEIRSLTEKLQKQGDAKRQLDSCTSSLADCREKAKAAKAPAKTETKPAKPKQKTPGR